MTRWLARVFGPTLEDWLLGLMMVAAIALAVLGVRSCERTSPHHTSGSTTDPIIARVWKDAPNTAPDTVRVHVASLRRKIEPDPSSPQYIVTEPWIGYRFIAEPLDR